MDSDKSISSIAKDLGLNKGTWSLWIGDYKKTHNIKSSKDLNKKLKKELTVLKQEKEILKKAAAYFVRYAWIKEYSQSFPIQLMCKLFSVSRSCYYN